MPCISTPLANKAYRLCRAIEKLPASEEATALSVQASNLLEEVSLFESHVLELAKKVVVPDDSNMATTHFSQQDLKVVLTALEDFRGFEKPQVRKIEARLRLKLENDQPEPTPAEGSTPH
jgi:hypothetical protein